MKTLALSFAVVALISWSSGTNAQQPHPNTCSQQLAFCTRGCDNASIHPQGRCRANCQRRQGDCMATGLWETPTGEKYPRQRQ